jgi:hypothetical protein
MIAKDPHQIKAQPQKHAWQTHTRVLLPVVAFILVLSVLSLSCNLFSGLKGMRVVPTADSQAGMTQSADYVAGTLSVFATQTAQAGAPSETPAPPTAFPTFTPTHTESAPTATETPPEASDAFSLPTTTPETPAGKIRFEEGATSAYVRKLIAAGEKHHYLVRALENQFLVLAISSPDDDVYLGVKGVADGDVLLAESAEESDWSGRLPSGQEYLVTVTTDNAETDYFLSIEVPAHIYFDPGAYSDTIDGYIEVNQTFHPAVLTRVRYRARAFGGQTMTVELSSSNIDDLSVAIVGQDTGETYLRYEVKNSGGEILLPSDQAYFIDVYAVNGVSTVFTLKLTIK